MQECQLNMPDPVNQLRNFGVSKDVPLPFMFFWRFNFRYIELLLFSEYRFYSSNVMILNHPGKQL